MNQQVTPENVLSNDPGDETQKRFRYQAVYAAIQSLSLLEDSEICSIYCEHHEDILVKKQDKTFVGIQVKTRANGKEPFKANDEDIQKSIKRFYEHDCMFGNSFSRYVLAANCGFWHDKKNGANLYYILELAGATTDFKNIPTALNSFIDKIYNLLKENKILTNEYDSSTLINFLKKVTLIQSPGLDDIEATLLRKLTQFSNIKDLRIDQVNRITKSLIDKCLNAASLVCDSPKEGYYSILANPNEERTKLIIKGKQITKEIILALLREVENDQFLLSTGNSIPLSKMPKGMKKLELKMAAGGISANNIDNIKDLKSSMENQLVTWLYKKGERKTKEQYEHIRIIVRNQCQEAHDLTRINNELFGNKMLNKVRECLDLVYKNKEGCSLFGLRYEHLLGMAGILTEECKIWWSEEFDINSEEFDINEEKSK
ncbi:dsDNA nuclease domain-containing protein [Microcoleus sp. Pol7_A1]|uniref:dsDNA nuclease domain-containing protein n=1 Tax=Microcoleus sp. Pol7_A1 TaxID=2818893 RepID=UPI002FD4BA6A